MHIFPQTTPHTSTTRRLHFLTSTRLAHHLTTTSNLLTSLSLSLGSCPPADLPDRVSQLAESARTAEKGLKGVKAELAALIGQSLKGRFAAGTTEVVFSHREAPLADGTTDTFFLSAVSAEVFPSPPTTDQLLILSGTPTPAGAAGSTSALHLSGSPALVAAFGERVKQAELFKGRVKGGGAKGKWQAKVEGPFGGVERTWVEGVVEELNGATAAA